MNVAFDISQTGPDKTGCGHFSYSLAEALLQESGSEKHKYTFLRTFGTSWWDAGNAEFTIPGADADACVGGFDEHGLAIEFWKQEASDLVSKLGEPAIIHSNNFYCLTNKGSAKLVYTLYDMTVFDFPQYASDENRRYCVGQIMAAAATADFILSISHATLSAFQAYFDVEPARLGVIDLGARATNGSGSHAPAGLSVARPFFLSVGTIEPRKNHDLLFMAYSKIAASIGIDLVVVGKMGWEMSHVRAAVVALGIESRVHFLSYVAEDDLEWLYAHALAFVYPSHAEGFGLPVLEAMTRGCPVICSNSTSLPEVAGDAAVYVRADDADGLAAKMLELAENSELRELLRSRAVVRSRYYSWPNAARQTKAIYDRVAALPPRVIK